MKTKIIPFDLETAKKIQAGEIEGKTVDVTIKKFTYNSHGCIAIDQKVNKFIELPEEAPKEQHPIKESELYQAGYNVGFKAGICVAFDEKKGYTIKKETPKHEFKPFDKVLVRNKDHETWNARLYDVWFAELGLHGTQDNKEWKQCIPYEGNQELVGTTDKPKEE